MKKIIAVLMALLMLASICVIAANAQSYTPVGGWKKSGQGPITVKKADPADVKKDGVISENEYEKLVIDQSEEETPLHVMYVSNDNLTDGLNMLATTEFWFSWDEVHGFNFAVKDKPANIQQILSPKDGDFPGDDFANNTAFVLNMLTDNGAEGTRDDEGYVSGTTEVPHYCVYYVLAKRTDNGKYIEGYYNENQLGMNGDYDPEPDVDYIINYTDDGYAIIEWSVPFSSVSSGTVGAGYSVFASITAMAGNAGPEDEMYQDTYGIGLGDKCFMIDAKVDKAGGFPEFILSDEPIKTAPVIDFTDVPADAYFADAVAWAVSKNVTTGTSPTTFSPSNPCTRAQVVTFLWRAAGEPKPTKSDNPFTDVPSGQYYYDAVLWAVENEITTGMSATSFAPNATCTRAQIVTFLYRYAKGTAPSATNPFKDVKSSDYFYAPVMWAVENEITTGMSSTSFAPTATCTRAQVVTFLYRLAG